MSQSKRCSSGGCVEVAHEDHRVLVRDSKYGDRGEESPSIEFTPSGWRSFLVVAQEWDRESTLFIAGVCIQQADEDQEHDVCILNHDTLVHLHFDGEEWDEFVKGAEAGEFVPEFKPEPAGGGPRGSGGNGASAGNGMGPAVSSGEVFRHYRQPWSGKP